MLKLTSPIAILNLDPLRGTLLATTSRPSVKKKVNCYSANPLSLSLPLFLSPSLSLSLPGDRQSWQPAIQQETNSTAVRWSVFKYLISRVQWVCSWSAVLYDSQQHGVGGVSAKQPRGGGAESMKSVLGGTTKNKTFRAAPWQIYIYWSGEFIVD